MAADERLTRSQAGALARHYHAPDKPWYSDTTACLPVKSVMIFCMSVS